MYQLLDILSGAFLVIGFVPYIWFIVKHRKSGIEGKPIKASWLIWATNDTIILTGMVLKGAYNGQIICAVICAWTVTILAFLYGNPGWKKIDIACAAGALIGLTFSVIYSNPTIAIIASNAVLIMGAIPTYISTLERPERENKTAWSLWILSCICAMLVIPKWDLDHAAQPITFFIIDGIEVVILWGLFYFRKPVEQK